MNKKTARSMEDQLRQAIRDSGKPQNEICRAAKMDEGTLSCFMLGKQESMRLKTAQRLALVLGMQLVLENGGIAAPRARSTAKARPKANAKRAAHVPRAGHNRRRRQTTA
jgi:hypothetical protein